MEKSIVRSPNLFLLIAAGISVVAGLLHYACIIVGAPLYRILGAGEEMARLAEQGNSHPHIMALIVGSMLMVLAVFALSAAGVIRALPLTRFVLCGFVLVLTLRALLFPFLQPYFPGNSDLFWWTSSAICFGYALVHAIGLRQVWDKL